MTSDVGHGSVEWLTVLALLIEVLSVLVEETVWVVEASLLKSEAISALWDTIHVGGVHSEIHTDRVALDV